MALPRPLPRELAGRPFSTRAALIHGVSPVRLAARDLERPFHGVNTPPGWDDLRERCQAYATRMLDGQAFSHRTAALLYGMPIPDCSPGEPLHVSVTVPRTPPRARGVNGHSLRTMQVGVIDGMAVCTPARVWVQLATTSGPEELVAIGDHIVGGRRRPALAGIDELVEAAGRVRTVKGAAALHWAAPRIRFGTDSRPESLLRLAVIDAGFSEPLVNPGVSLPDGTVVHPDLVFPDRRILLEYEGDGHRTDAVQWQRDIHRYERMVSAGWSVIRVTSRDLFRDRAALMDRIRAAS